MSISFFCLLNRLEIGVQSVYEDIARDTNRGHTVKAVCENFNLAKDAGFKVIHLKSLWMFDHHCPHWNVNVYKIILS